VSTNFAKPMPNVSDVILLRHKQPISSYTDQHTPLHCSTLEFGRGVQSSSRPGHQQISSRHRPYLIEKTVLEKASSDMATLVTPHHNNLQPWLVA